MTTLTLFIETATQTFTYRIDGDQATITGPNGETETIIIGDRSFDNSVRRACMDIGNRFLEEVRNTKEKKLADQARVLSEESDRKKKKQGESSSEPSPDANHL